MGEIFNWRRAARALDFTGERWTSAVGGQIEFEHFHRYLVARDLCRDKDVLDIACGEGYGAALLGRVARRVVAVDIDHASVSHAAAEYAALNVHYVAGDARRIPLAGGSIDVVVSFETFEHFAEQEAFLAELCRVLRPGGLLVISTPDSDVYSPIGGPANPYHVRELSREEFAAALSSHFRHVVLLSQRALLGSAIVPRSTAPAAPLVTYERRDDLHFERSPGLPRAMYLLACASQLPIVEPPGTSLYIDTGQVDSLTARAEREALQAEQRAAEATAARAEHERLQTEQRAAEATAARAELEALQAEQRAAEATAARAELEALQAELRAAEATAARAERQAAEAAGALAAVLNSTSWRLLGPARRISHRFPGLARLGRRGLKLAWWTLTLQVGAKLREFRAARMAALDLVTPDGSRSIETRPDPASEPRGSDGTMALEQTRALGLHFHPPAIRDVAVGIVTYQTSTEELRRIISSTQMALRRAGLATAGRVMVLDNGVSTDAATIGDRCVRRLPAADNIGFGRAHNRLMRAALDSGAEIYVAINPDGMLHPDALIAMLQMIQVNADRVLVEATQFPEEHPKIYDPLTFDTPWASAACLAIPRVVVDRIGGFDESFFMYCEDVDFSWRARAAGFGVKICPRALFLHSVTNRPESAATRRLFLNSGVLLARKWGGAKFEARLRAELRRAGYPLPLDQPEPVPAEWRSIADFSQQFSFALARW